MKIENKTCFKRREEMRENDGGDESKQGIL
jgi:hypothetical protein